MFINSNINTEYKKIRKTKNKRYILDIGGHQKSSIGQINKPLALFKIKPTIGISDKKRIIMHIYI